VHLADEERRELEKSSFTRKAHAGKLLYARILLRSRGRWAYLDRRADSWSPRGECCHRSTRKNSATL